MTYRDPLYDANAPASEGTLDEQMEHMAPESQTDQAKSKAEDLGNQGKQAAEKAREKGEEVAGQAREKGQEMMDQAQTKAGQVSRTAEAKADQGVDRASEGLSTAADKLREQGQGQGGQAGHMAETAAEKLDSASGYLREHDTNQMVDDLEALVRRRPIESVLAAAGIGLLLSRIIR